MVGLWTRRKTRLMRDLLRGNIRLLTGLFACAIGAASLQAALAPSTPPPSTAVKVEGKYNVKVGGFYQGDGNAAVNGGVLSITAKVTDETGHAGDFTVTGIKIDATNHFRGQGLVQGKSLSITGRLDPLDTAETQLKTARITANFSVSDGHRGRVVGYVPITPGGTDTSNTPTTPTVPTTLIPPESPTVPVPKPPTPTPPPTPTKPTPPKAPTTPKQPGDD